jgi:NAD(P)-dependent dehydrogenase (short-subunit alcohol dehydrogenase family)
MQGMVGKVAFVTGGAGSIGLSVARALAAHGSKLALTYCKQASLRKITEFKEVHPDVDVLPVRVDLTNRAAVLTAAAEEQRHFGRVPLVCNCARIVPPVGWPVLAEADRVLRLNVGGVTNAIASFLPHIKSHGEGGHIISLASLSSCMPSSHGASYAASMFALRGMTDSLRRSLERFRIGASLLWVTDDERGEVASLDRHLLEGILHNCLFIGAPESVSDELRARHAQILAAFPDEPPNPLRASIARRHREARKRVSL